MNNFFGRSNYDEHHRRDEVVHGLLAMQGQTTDEFRRLVDEQRHELARHREREEYLELQTIRLNQMLDQAKAELSRRPHEPAPLFDTLAARLGDPLRDRSPRKKYRHA